MRSKAIPLVGLYPTCRLGSRQSCGPPQPQQYMEIPYLRILEMAKHILRFQLRPCPRILQKSTCFGFLSCHHDTNMLTKANSGRKGFFYLSVHHGAEVVQGITWGHTQEATNAGCSLVLYSLTMLCSPECPAKGTVPTTVKTGLPIPVKAIKIAVISLP